MSSNGFPTISNTKASFQTAMKVARGAVQKSTLGQLEDVTATGAVDNQTIVYNESTKKWEAKSLTTIPTIVPQDLSDLKDVDDTAPTNGQSLVYDSGTSLWKASTAGTVSSAIGQLTDVDIATLAPYDGARLEYNVNDDGATKNWAVAPLDSTTIWVTPLGSGGNDNNDGTTTGKSLATMQTAFQRVLQKGSVVSSKINLKLADIPWDTSTNNLINANLLNGPSFTTLNMNGHSQDFSTVIGGGTIKTTGSIRSEYTITVSGKTISSAWNCTAFSTDIKWGQFLINSINVTLPIMVDDQVNNTTARVYLAYWDRTADPGFAVTPSFILRSLADATAITHSTSFYGPMSVTNLIIKGPDASELKFLNSVNMQYVEVQSTTPASATTHIVFEGQNTQCRFCRFTSLTIACSGSSITPASDTTTTFVNCIFYKCTFTEVNNVRFLGCIFYRNPILFNNISAKASFETCTFIYSDTPTTAGIMSVIDSTIIMSNCVIGTENYASGTAPLTIPQIISDSSYISLTGIKVPTGILDITTGGIDVYSTNAAYLLANNNSNIIVTAGKITAATGTRALFVARNSSQISLNNIEIDAATYTLLSAMDSRVNIYNFLNKLKLTSLLYAIRSYITMNTIKVLASVTNVITGTFLNTQQCVVKAGESSVNTGIYVDLHHTNTNKFLNDVGSTIDLVLVPNVAVIQMYGTIHLNNTILRGKAVTNGTKQVVTFKNGTGVAGANLDVTNSIVYLQDMSFENSHTTNGIGIHAKNNSRINLEYLIIQADNGVATANNQGLVAENNSSIVMNGKFEFVSTAADNVPAIECSGGSTISLTPNFTLAEATNLTIQRNSTGAGTAPILSVTEGSKLFIANRGTDKNNSANSDAITITAPHILLKGLSANTGQAPFLINNSICQIEQSKLEFNKLNGPGIIRNGSKLIVRQCSITDTSSSGQRLNYFNVEDSELIITGKGESVQYIPKLNVQALASATQGVILASNSKVTFVDIEVENVDTLNPLQTLIKASNCSTVLYNSPTTPDVAKGFGVGVQLRSNSKCSYKSAGADIPLTCTVDLLLGLLAGADDNARKLVDMSAGQVIIPFLSDNWNGTKPILNAAEGCNATIVVDP